MRRGLFGGTFDPPHIGHLIVARDAAGALGLDQVVFLPAGRPPHKRHREISPAADRVALVQAAVAEDPCFVVDDRETRRTGPSWTVDTLRELRAEHATDDLVLLLGADQYVDFETWRDPEDIRALGMVAVLDRGGAEINADVRDRHVRVTRIDVSASAIRKRVRDGVSIRYLVPAAVEAMIRARALYVDHARAVSRAKRGT